MEAAASSSGSGTGPVGPRVAALAAAIDGLLDLSDEPLTGDELHELVLGVERQRDRLTVAAFDQLARWDDSKVWRSDGSLLASARLALELHRAPYRCGRDLGTARSLRHLPRARAAVLAGRLSLDDVEVLARARRDDPAVFDAHEETLVDTIIPLTHGDAASAVDYWRQHVLPDLAEHAADRRRARTHLFASTTLDGTVEVSGRLDPVAGAIVTGELDRLIADIKARDARDGVTRTASQRRAAALVEMATRSASATPATRARPLFTVLIGDDTARRLCELSTGTVITPGDAHHYADLALVESVLFDGPKRLIATTKRRTFTGAIRRGIQVRDRHCTHPGCTIPAEHCDIDHIVPYTQRPITDQAGGRLRCAGHNRIRGLDHHDRPGTIPTKADPTVLDQLRTLIRWRHHTHWPDTDDDPDPDGDID
jgi:hypothetical protein